MHDLVEYYYHDIVADYVFPKNAKDNPEIEDIDFMEDKKFLEYAEKWVAERGE